MLVCERDMRVSLWSCSGPIRADRSFSVSEPVLSIRRVAGDGEDDKDDRGLNAVGGVFIIMSAAEPVDPKMGIACGGMLEIPLWPRPRPVAVLVLGRGSGMLLLEGEVDDDMEEGMTATECRFTSRDTFGENTLGVIVVDTMSDIITPLPATIIAGEDKVVAEEEDAERARATGKE